MLFTATLKEKSFLGLQENVVNEREEKAKEAKAKEHYSIHSKEKVFKLLKLIFELRNKSSPFEIGKMKSVAYEFILSSLLSVKSNKDTSFIDFNSKIN